MNRSTKFNFYLPQITDPIDPSDYNYNFELIDSNLITESQSFTDTQKSTARTNIGAANASDLGAKSSASGVTGDDAFSKINAVNNKTMWEYLGEETGTTYISINKTFQEIMVVAMWGLNNLVTVSCNYSYHSLDTKRRFIGGTYTSATDYHGVQIDIERTKVQLVQWKTNSGDQTSSSKIRVYIR